MIRWRRLIILAVLALFVLANAYFVVTVFQVWRTARADGARGAEAIVVLGAAQYDGRPSEEFAARLDHAAELYHEGIAPVIVVTGGKQVGDRFTEAAAGAEHLHDLGVPDASILREVQGRSTYESLRATERFLAERDIDEVVVVTSPFHALRARLIAREVGLDATISPATDGPVSGMAEWRRFGGEAARIMLGRPFGFDRLQRVVGAGDGQVAMIVRSSGLRTATRSGVV